MSLLVQALQRILYLRQYNGRVSFVPAPGFENHGEPSTYSEQNICNPIPSQQQPIKILQHGYQGPDVDLKNLEWRIINGPFVAVWLHNVPWGSENTMAAPDAKVSSFAFLLGYTTLRNTVLSLPFFFFFISSLV